MSYLHLARVSAGLFRDERHSDAESSASADEYEDADSGNEYDTDQCRESELPSQFLGVTIRRGIERAQRSHVNTIERGDTHNMSSGSMVDPNREHGQNNNNQRTQRPIEANGPPIEADGPPSPWRTSKAKQTIINDLKDTTSDIHLHIGSYVPKNWKDVKFRPLWKKYATRNLLKQF